MLLAQSEITREVDRAMLLIGGMSVILLVGITAAMIYLAIRYRRGRTRTTTQVEGNTVLEIVWTVIPTIIVVWMFFVGYQGFGLMRSIPAEGLVVEVTGKQWVWSFYYPEEKIGSTEMVVPVNTPIIVKLTSPPGDVIHSFYIPDFRVKEDSLPGRESSMWFEAEREGTYTILCAEFCGKDHSKMIAMLKVVSADNYAKWVRDQELKRLRPLEFAAVEDPQHPGFGADELNIDRKALYSAFCASCHGANGDGSGLPGEARNLTAAKGWKRGQKVTDIYRTLTEGIEGGRMRPYPNFTPWERVALAHHVRAFSKETLPKDTEDDYQALITEYGLDKVQTPKETLPIEQAMEILVKEAKTTAKPENE